MYLLAIDGGLRRASSARPRTGRTSTRRRGTVRVNKALEEVDGELNIKAPKTQVVGGPP